MQVVTSQLVSSKWFCIPIDKSQSVVVPNLSTVCKIPPSQEKKQLLRLSVITHLCLALGRGRTNQKLYQTSNKGWFHPKCYWLEYPMWVQTASSQKYVLYQLHGTAQKWPRPLIFGGIWKTEKNISHWAINSQKSTPFFSLWPPSKKKVLKTNSSKYRYLLSGTYNQLTNRLTSSKIVQNHFRKPHPVKGTTSLRGRFKSRSPRAEETTTPGAISAGISGGKPTEQWKKPGFIWGL